MTQLSLYRGESAKLQGIELVGLKGSAFVTLMRGVAAAICRERGSVTCDDLREYAAGNDISPHHPNAWGAIFRPPTWKCIGRRKSAFPSNHAREIRVWRLA